MTLLAFFAFVYFFCSIQYRNVTRLKIPHNILGKLLIKLVKFVRKFDNKYSFQTLFNTIDYIKCPIFMVLSAILFQKKHILDITAIVSYTAHYFPIWSGFRNDNKNFISIIFAGFILDPITGISMIVAFLLSARSFGYTSVAITSSMLVGIIKTMIHIVFFDKNDYIESFFFIFFGALAIYKNRKVLLYICSKSAKQDIIFYKKKVNETNKEEYCQKKEDELSKKVIKEKKKLKKTSFYRNYKKFYKNNKIFNKEEKL